MRSSPFVLRFLFALGLFLSLGNLCTAQFKATMQGSITDPQGVAVGGATVKVQDQATGVRHDSVARQVSIALPNPAQAYTPSPFKRQDLNWRS